MLNSRVAVIMAQLDETARQQWSEQLDTPLEILRSGGVVALPTDTLFGLAANVFDETALQRVFDIKGRPASQPLPVLVNGMDMAARVAADAPPAAFRLAEQFWPGQLTLVLPAHPELSPLVTAGGDTVAVRSPAHWAPQQLIGRLGGPITGTSANRSGGPDLVTLGEVRRELGGLVDCIVDCGPLPLGTASTIVALIGKTPKLIREGVIPFKAVLEVLG